MASRDPFSGVDPAIVNMLQQRFGPSATPSGPVDPEIRRSILKRFGADIEGPGFLERAEGVSKTLTALLPMSPDDPETQARRAAALSGIARGAILEPLEAIIGIPRATSHFAGTVLEQMGAESGKGFLGAVMDQKRDVQQLSDSAIDFLIRAKEGLYTNAEFFAKESSGLSDIQIADAHSVGNLLGFVAPIAGSVKGAQALLRAPQALSKVPLSSSLMVDFTAGLIFGGALRPGDTVGERFAHMGEEAAAFGVFRILASSGTGVYKVWRTRRLRSMGISKEMQEMLEALERGETPEVSREVVEDFARLISEEELLIKSPAAQKLVEQGRTEEALFRAVRESGEESGGVLSGLTGSHSELQGIIRKLKKADDSDLKFDIFKAGDGRWTVAFGRKGLSNVQKREMKEFGLFSSQKVEKAGKEYEVLRPKPDQRGRIRVRKANGKATWIKPEGVTPKMRYVEELDITDGEILFKNFREFFERKSQEILDSPGPLSTTDLIRGIREGTIEITENLRRDLNLPGAIAYPEEVGFKTTPMGVPASQEAQRVAVKMGEAAERAASGPPTSPIAKIRLVDPADGSEVFLKRAPGDGEEWVAEIADSRTGEILQSSTFGNLDEARRWAANSGMEETEIVPLIASQVEVAQNILRTGSEAGGVMTPGPIVNHRDLFNAWIRERGLPEGSPDLKALRVFFNKKLVDDLYKGIPEEDRIIFEGIQEELDELIETQGLPLETLAQTKGFRSEILNDGGVILQDLETGRTFRAPSERGAFDALAAMSREGDDLLPDLVPWNLMGGRPILRQLDRPESVWSFDEHIQTEEWLEAIDDALGLQFTKNIRDLMVRLEETTHIPLWSEGFSKVDDGLQQMRIELEPLAHEVQNIWKGIGKKQKERIVDFWTEVEGTDAGLPALVKQMKELGFSSKEIRAFERARTVFEHLYQIGAEEGIFKRGQYIKNYYSRVLPYMKKHGRFDPDAIWPEGVPPEFQFWAEMSRTGELPTIETDPEVVMHKYLYRLLWKKNVYGPWKSMTELTGTTKEGAMKIKDLPVEVRNQVLKNNPAATPENNVLPDTLLNIIREYLNTVRGAPVAGFKQLRKTNNRIFRRLGMDADDRILEEYHNIAMSGMYGAAMGLRPILVTRNSVQNYWMMYSRLGSRHAARGMEMAFTEEGVNEVIDAGAIRIAEAGIPQADAFFKAWQNHPELITGKGPFSRAAASVVRAGLRVGSVSKKMAQKFLVPYSAQDQANRAWAYHWQKLHTDEWLSKYEAREIGWEKFREEGLPFFAGPVKQEFEQLYKRVGKEKALRFIGKQAADESNFIYQAGTQPTLLQGPLGRLFGMFGTWPVWALEHYYRRFKLGTPGQKAAFVARTGAMAGVFGLIGYETGRDLWSWMAPASVAFGGGPFTEYVWDLRSIIEAPVDQKAQAIRRLAFDVGRLIIPGQVALSDFSKALDQRDPREAALSMVLGAPADQRAGNFAMDWMYRSDIPVSVEPFVRNKERLVGPIDGSPIIGRELPRFRRRYSEEIPVDPDFSTLRGNIR